MLANRGGPGNPLTVDELVVKFRGNATRALAAEKAEALAAAILDPRPRPVAELLALARM